MDQVSSLLPLTKEAPLPLTREAILSLNNGSTTFEQARSLFNVDLSTFKAKLLQENIFVWNEVHYGPVRIHGDDSFIDILFKKLRKLIRVQAIDTFADVISIIEMELMLSPGCYKLTYKHPSNGNVLVKTDRDWHFAVEFSKVTGGCLRSDLVFLSSGQTADEDASDEDASDEDA
ncbi:YTH domain-containing family protein [Tanacetum coccineum]